MDEKAVDNVDRFVHNVERRGKKGVEKILSKDGIRSGKNVNKL
ncbi:MAG: hypothetical protein ACOX4H_11720 [Bacillota bacterium]